jgi:hypothetical protein
MLDDISLMAAPFCQHLWHHVLASLSLLHRSLRKGRPFLESLRTLAVITLRNTDDLTCASGGVSCVRMHTVVDVLRPKLSLAGVSQITGYILRRPSRPCAILVCRFQLWGL